MEKMDSDLIPSELIKKASRKWWVFAALMILGGLAGMLFTRIQKPVYQSQAVITIAIDYAYTGRLEDYELDHLIMAVGDLIDSTTVRRQVLVESQLQGIREETLARDLTAIRKGNAWILSVRASDPESARVLAETWANTAMAVLFKMNQQALADFHNQVAMLSIEKCFSESVVVDSPVAGCSADDIDKLKSFLSGDSDTTNSLRNSVLLSNLSFEITTTPVKPASPLLFRQNLNVGAGAFIGLIVALAWFFLGRKARK
jgi:hypothetical protein